MAASAKQRTKARFLAALGMTGLGEVLNMATTPTPNSTRLESLPAWARELSEKYYSRTLAMFVLYGNVRDYVPVKREGATQFLSLPRFLNEALFPRRDLILSYDRGGGLTFAQPEAQSGFPPCLVRL